MRAKPSPKLSRRWAVTTINFLAGSNCGHAGAGRRPAANASRTYSTASIPELPVTEMRRGSIPSANKLRCAISVGAKCRAASRVAITRFISSGNGCHRSPVRSPASTWPDRHSLIECRQRAGEGGGGVALHQQHIRPLGLDHRLERRQDARGELGQSLPGLHQVQVVIRRDFEGGQHLIEHGAVLCGHAYAHLELPALPEIQQHRDRA